MIMYNESVVRLIFFVSILLIIGVWELCAPMRKLLISKKDRWLNNLSLILMNALLLKILFPVTAVGVAIFCAKYNVGILNFLVIPSWLKFIVAFLVLDFAIYIQHVLFHYLPFFWRFHKVHHADLDFDLTTGLRFHPIEIILSMLIKMVVICFIGAPAIAVIVFEIVLNGTSLFNHGNIRLPYSLDKILRIVTVTPDVHRVHHSDIIKETNSNFGFNLIVWDRLLGTYIEEPKKGHILTRIGLPEYKNPKITQNIWNMLKMPFRK